MSAQGIPSLRRDPADPRRQATSIANKIDEYLEDELSGRRAMNAIARLEKLDPMRSSSETSSLGGLAEGMGKIVTGMAEGFQGLSKLQQSMLESLLAGQQKGGGDQSTQLLTMLVLSMMQDQKKSGGGEEGFWREQFVGLVNRRIEELEGQRGMSPTDAQFHQLTQQVAAQAMQGMLDPLSSIKRLKEAREHLGQLGLDGGGGQFSDGHLRMKALENEAEALRYQHYRQTAEREQKQQFLERGIPTYIAAAGDQLRNVLGSFGLVPVYQGGQRPGADGGQRPFSSVARGEATAPQRS